MRLLRRQGRALLLLPGKADLAAASWELYPAQSRKARWMRSLSKFLLRFGLNAGLEKLSLRIDESDPLYGYLAQTAGVAAADLEFAMLAGNPNTAGQRCIFLLFTARGQPAAVVKAGTGTAAVELIERERAFLAGVPVNLPGLPRLRSSFREDAIAALAVDFFPGTTPDPNEWESAGKLLTAWVFPARTVPIQELPLWTRLLQTMNFPGEFKALGAAVVSPALFHGDFAPWNIKVIGGNWTVLDWERGELVGLPLWDWLHFVIQPMVLVERADTASILKKLELLFEFPRFKDYTALTRIQGLEKQLTRAYVSYCLNVLRPSEGMESLGALAETLPGAWNK